MKIFFVCNGNVIRSQVAQALFTKYTGKKAFSAGLELSIEGQKLIDKPSAKQVIAEIRKKGIDISQNTRNLFNPKIVEQFDKIIYMADKQNLPTSLKNNKKVVFWDIEEPEGMSEEGLKIIISNINKLVKKFIEDYNINQN